MNWINIKDSLPENDNDFCLFVELYNGIIIQSWARTFLKIKQWRKSELENSYTHWILLPEPPKQ